MNPLYNVFHDNKSQTGLQYVLKMFKTKPAGKTLYNKSILLEVPV